MCCYIATKGKMEKIEHFNGFDTSVGVDPIASSSRFSAGRAVEYLLYICKRVAAPTIHELLKIRYFADKVHLSHYGMTGSGDNYVAMRFGPVGSSTYDLLKAARGEESRFIPQEYYRVVSGALRVTNENVLALREANVDELSQADIECLDAAIAEYGNMHFGTRTDISHDDAWKKGWEIAQRNQTLQGKMELVDIVHTLENADDVLECLSA